MKVLLVPLTLLAITLAGCTGGGDSGTTPPMDEEGRYIIELGGNMNTFRPDDAGVPVGATVVFKHMGGSHNVVPDGHSEFTGTTVTNTAGEHLVVTFENAGTFAFYCDPHKSVGMKGSIIVG